VKSDKRISYTEYTKKNFNLIFQLYFIMLQGTKNVIEVEWYVSFWPDDVCTSILGENINTAN
jgi:hypothetical protein